jgi:cell division protein FtsB
VAAPAKGDGVGVVRPRLTSRAAVLVLVLGVLLVSYASSLRAYVDQRRHVADLEDSIASSRADIEGLKREKQRWQDPAYVVAQARARFAFGFPGEMGYLVLDADGKPLDHEDSLSDPSVGKTPDPQWWQTTLASVDTAGSPPAAKAEPVKRLVDPDPQGGG